MHSVGSIMHPCILSLIDEAIPSIICSFTHVIGVLVCAGLGALGLAYPSARSWLKLWEARCGLSQTALVKAASSGMQRHANDVLVDGRAVLSDLEPSPYMWTETTDNVA